MSDELDEEVETFNDPFELMDESLKLKDDIKIQKKALKDVTNRLVNEIHCDIGFVKEAQKMLAAEGKDKGDTLKDTFDKLINVILTFRQIGYVEHLAPYFDKLEAAGISLKIEDTESAASDTVKEGWKDSVSYLRSIKEKQDIISNTHAPNSEDINFAPKEEYKGLLSIYSKKLKGKDVDDAVQERVTYFEMAETAYNLVGDKEL